jgi:hypothetical protein
VLSHFLIATVLGHFFIATMLSYSSLIQRSIIPHCYSAQLFFYCYSAKSFIRLQRGWEAAQSGKKSVHEVARGSVASVRDQAEWDGARDHAGPSRTCGACGRVCLTRSVSWPVGLGDGSEWWIVAIYIRNRDLKEHGLVNKRWLAKHSRYDTPSPRQREIGSCTRVLY